MLDIEAATVGFKPKSFFKTIKYKLEFARSHPDYFGADGLLCFCGSQGSGKTLSAVNYVIRLMKKYPKCKLVSNIAIKEYPIVTFEDFVNQNEAYVKACKEDSIPQYQINQRLKEKYLKENRVFEFQDNDDLTRYNNGEFGVVYLIDEIQLYMNSLQSKNIDMDVMTQISQQRKQRKHIVATSQVFGRMAKPLREQFSCVILCKCYFKLFQINKMIDRDSIGESDNSTGTELTGEVKKKFFYIHSPEMYESYDTYCVIKKDKFKDIKGGTNFYGLPNNN